MGSFVSQLATVAEICRDENGYYARFFGFLYRKILKKWEVIFHGNAFPETLDGQILVKMAEYFHREPTGHSEKNMGNMGISRAKIWEEYGRFWHFSSFLTGKYGKYGRFDQPFLKLYAD